MPDSRDERIGAVVVTYNRQALLGQCLDALLGQSYPLDAILIIDNCSTDGTYESLLSSNLIAAAEDPGGTPSESVRAVPVAAGSGRDVEIRYVRMPENTGGAGGFHEGMRRAVEAGFDWLWLMDDDLLPTPEALQALIDKREALAGAQDRPFLLNSLVLSKEHRDEETLAFPLQELSKGGFPRLGVYYWHLSEVRDKVREGLYRWACPFNGTFLSATAIAEIGLPNKDFFIWGDERDFLWRAAKVLDFYTVIDSKAFHPESPGLAFNWKLYYHIRNAFVVNEHLNLTFLRNLKLTIASVVLGLRHGRKGLALVSRAVKDGLMRNLGRRQDLLP
ncbi:MAG: glycosyltransferase family 2 protein [Planctomycetota bacterium]|jgi:GT2 family glycosyltransferase